MANEAMVSQSTALENVVQDSLSQAWEVFKKDAVLLILANLVMTAITIVSLGILFAPLTVGMIGIVRKRLNDEPASVGNVFDGFSSFGSSFVAGLIIGVGTILGCILLIVPGVVFAFMCAFTFHGIAYRSLGAMDAIKHSFALVKGHLAVIAVLMLIAVALNMVGGMVWIGGLLTGPFTMVMLTVAYQRLSANLT